MVDMDPLAKRQYDRERYLARRVLKKTGVFKSKYRYINNGNGQGITAHKAIAERVLGKSLPNGAAIHHVDGNGLNNSHSNLVICPSHAYHMLLHRRQAAMEACGNPDWLKCVFCGEYDDPRNLSLYTPKDQTSPRANHRQCHTKYQRRRKGGVA